MTKWLLDMGLPRRAAQDLRAQTWDIQHVGELGMITASDEQIVDVAQRTGRVIVTLDNDFSRILSLRNTSTPSVVHI